MIFSGIFSGSAINILLSKGGWRQASVCFLPQKDEASTVGLSDLPGIYPSITRAF